YFVDHVVDGEGIEACNYLLAVDVEMTPVPGYRFANWDQGYGDMKAVPDLTTLRPIPWLEKTAIVLCDLVDDESATPVEVSPRRILQRQVERAAAAGYTVKCGAGLEVFLCPASYRERGGQGLRRPGASLARHRGLPRAPDDARRVPDPGDPERHGRLRGPRRVLEGRSGPRSARDQPRVCRRARDGRPPRDLQERRQGDRVARGAV